MLTFLADNYQAILALIAIGGVVINFIQLYFQRRRDSADEVAQRVDAAAKIVKSATDLMTPLEHRVDDLEKDNKRFEELVKAQATQIENLQKQNDELRYELRAIKADRESLLRRVLILQEAGDASKLLIDELRGENTGLRKRIDELETESRKFRKDKCDEDAAAG